MKKILLLFALLFSASYTFGYGQASKAFSYLKWTNGELDKFMESSLGYDESTFEYKLVPCDQLPTQHPCYISDNYLEYKLLGVYKPNGRKIPLYVLYSPGPSADPTFKICNEKGEEIFEQVTDELALMGTGIMYTYGHSDDMFYRRNKWKIEGNRVVRIDQPYYYVGISGELRKPVKLYSEREGGEVVATLPKGYQIEILLAEKVEDEDKVPLRYLARTDFGLVGWLRVDMDSFMDPIVIGLSYWGD